MLKKMDGVRELLSKSFKLFKDRFIGAFLIMTVSGILISLIRLAYPPLVSSVSISLSAVPSLSTILAVLGLIVLFVSVSILQAWSIVALNTDLFSDKKISFFEAFKVSRKNIIPFWTIGALLICITLGGLFLFIIPMFIFVTWFSFSQFILITENIKDFHALMKSREYVRGYWWAVFGRSVLGFLIYFAVFLAVSGCATLLKIVPDTLSSKILFYLSQVICTIFTFCYSFQVFRNLKQIKGDIKTKITRKSKIIYTIIGLLGLVLAIAIPIFMVTTPRNFYTVQ